MIRFLPVAALALILTGCAATPVAGTPSSEVSSVTSAEAAANAAAGGGSSTPYDACGLLSASEVEALIGKNDGGQASTAPGGGGGCVWTNTDNQYSVSVDIGDPDTALNGLPTLDPAVGPAEPLPGGMRYFASAVEFAAKGRDCQVQVSTLDSTPGGDKAAAAKLATEIEAKVQ